MTVSMKHLLYIVLVGVFLVSCNDEVPRSLKAKPSALSKLNDVVVVADNDVWEGMVGDTFQYYFASAYPILPRPEPFFDLRHFTVDQLNAEPLRRELRTYVVLVNLSDTESSTTKMFKRDIGEDRFYKAIEDPKFNSSVGRDKWARGQLLVYLFGNSEDELNGLIKDNFSAVAKRIHMHDRDALHAQVYAQKENKGLTDALMSRYGYELMIPDDYVLVEENEEDNLTWLRKDIEEGGTMNLVFRDYTYTDQSQLAQENVMAIRSDYGKRYVKTNTVGSYMQNNSTDLPIYDYTREIDGQYAREYRGIWEMTDDFIGGSFATYMIHNKFNDRLYYVDCWVFAPGKDKRDLMQQLEYMVSSINFIEEIGEE